MFTNYRNCIWTTVFLLCVTQQAYGRPGESIVLNQGTSNYTVTYFGYDDVSGEQTALRTVILEPATKIAPSIRTTLKFQGGGIIEYGYYIRNGLGAKQSLGTILLDPVANAISIEQLAMSGQKLASNATAEDYGIAIYLINNPPNWIGRIIKSQKNLGALRVGWDSTRGGVMPGASLGGFSFFSSMLPSISVAQVRGNTEITVWPDDGPDGEIGDQLANLEQNDFVPVNIAVPAISVPAPFDAAVLLDRIRAHVTTWPSKQLADPTFFAQLDRYLVAAAEAYRHNQPKAAKEHLETLRDMLKRVHKNLDDDEASEDRQDEQHHEHATSPIQAIDRLAARVLDFDLRYVLKRMELDEGKSKK